MQACSVCRERGHNISTCPYERILNTALCTAAAVIRQQHTLMMQHVRRLNTRAREDAATIVTIRQQATDAHTALQRTQGDLQETEAKLIGAQFDHEEATFAALQARVDADSAELRAQMAEKTLDEQLQYAEGMAVGIERWRENIIQAATEPPNALNP